MREVLIICYFSQFYDPFLCKIKMPEALLTVLKKREVLIIFITLPLTCVCNVLMIIKYFLTIILITTVSETKLWSKMKNNKIFQNLEKSAREGTRNTFFFIWPKTTLKTVHAVFFLEVHQHVNSISYLY